MPIIPGLPAPCVYRSPAPPPRRAGIARSLTGARSVGRFLAALAIVSGAVLTAGAGAEVAAQGGAAATVRPVDPERKDFRHERHRAVPCGECHGIDQRHRLQRSWTDRDCAACHHRDATPAGCTSCHERSSILAPRRTRIEMTLSVWADPRMRDLEFDHRRHTEVGCLDCHRGGMGLPPEGCSTCHTQHHRPDAECAHCHVAPEPAVHGLAAHGSCGGAGCHSDAATQRPMMSRPSCLVCHEAQREHRPDRSCVQCHIMPRAASRGGEVGNHGDL
jgi:hypothetical protein